MYHQYTICVKNPDALIEKFKKESIGFSIYYPHGNNQQPIMQKLGFIARVPVTEKLYKEVISIHVQPLVSEEDREKIAKVILSNVR